MDNQNKTIWIFVDETGTVSLNDKQSKYFGLGFFCTTDPVITSGIVSEAKYEVWNYLSGNVDVKKNVVECFHAKDDPKPRKKVLMDKIEQSNLCNDSFVFYYLDKSKFYNIIKNDGLSKETLDEMSIVIYQFLLSEILVYMSLTNKKSQDDKKDIFLVVSKLFESDKNKKIIRDLHQLQIESANTQFPYTLKVAITPISHDANAQIADYFSWYMNNYLTKNNDINFLNQIKNYIMPNAYKEYGKLDSQDYNGWFDLDKSCFDMTDRLVKIVQKTRQNNGLE